MGDSVSWATSIIWLVDWLMTRLRHHDCWLVGGRNGVRQEEES